MSGRKLNFVVHENLAVNSTLIDPLRYSLSRLGIENELVYNETDSAIMEFVLRHKQDANIIWAGPYRRQNRDRCHPAAPFLLWMEHGYGIDHYNTVTIDPQGHNAKSSIPYTNLENFSYTEDNYEQCNKWLAQHYYANLQSEPYRHLEEKLQTLLTDKFIYLPLQLSYDTVIEYDTPTWFTNYRDLVELVLRQLPNEYKLIYKVHPKDTAQRKQFSGDERLVDLYALFGGSKFSSQENDYINFWLLTQCTAMLTVNSSLITQALIRNVPVWTIGWGPYTGHQVVKECISFSDLIDFEWKADIKQCRNYITEIQWFRQLHTSQMGNLEDVMRVFLRLNQVYEQLWQEPLLGV